MANLTLLTDFILRCKEQVFKQARLRKSFCYGHQDQESTGVSLRRRLCYAVGGVPYQMTTIAIGVSLQIFLLDVVQMEAFYVSMILFVSRAWDAITDPLIGYWVSRSRWTPIGKLSPWLVLSAPFAVLSYLLLWFVPSMSAAQTVVWFLSVTCVFEALMSCFHVPFLSLNMFLGGSKRDRDSTTAYRMSVEMVAMLVASIIQGQVVAVYNNEKQRNCEDLEQVQEAAQSTSSPILLQGTKRAFLTSALVIGAMFFLCSLVVFLGVKEQRSPDGSDSKNRLPFLTSFKLLVCFAPYHRLVLGFTVSTLAYQISLGNFALFCSHAAGLGAHFQHLLLVLLLFIPAVILVACVPGSLPVLLFTCVLMGFSVATVFLLPWSMLPDVVDEFAVRNPDSTDLEPLFFSCYAFCNKLAGGVAAGVSTMTLQFVGYKSGACNHSDEVVTALIVLFSPVPIALLLLGMLAFLFCPVNERESSRLQEHIRTVDSKVLSCSSDQRECVDGTLCVTMTTTTPALSDKINVNKLNEGPGKYCRPKCVHHPSADNKKKHRGTDTSRFSPELNVKSKVSWV